VETRNFITKKFLRANSNILITKTDKDNATVALDKNHYIHEIESMLANEETYSRVDKDPTKNITR